MSRFGPGAASSRKTDFKSGSQGPKTPTNRELSEMSNAGLLKVLYDSNRKAYNHVILDTPFNRSHDADDISDAHTHLGSKDINNLKSRASSFITGASGSSEDILKDRLIWLIQLPRLIKQEEELRQRLLEVEAKFEEAKNASQVLDAEMNKTLQTIRSLKASSQELGQQVVEQQKKKATLEKTNITESQRQEELAQQTREVQERNAELQSQLARPAEEVRVTETVKAELKAAQVANAKLQGENKILLSSQQVDKRNNDKLRADNNKLIADNIISVQGKIAAIKDLTNTKVALEQQNTQLEKENRKLRTDHQNQLKKQQTERQRQLTQQQQENAALQSQLAQLQTEHKAAQDAKVAADLASAALQQEKNAELEQKNTALAQQQEANTALEERLATAQKAAQDANTAKDVTQSQLATKNTEHAEALEQLQTDRQAAQGALQSQLAAETEKTNLERQRATELEKQAQEALTKANSEHATAQQGAQERNAALAAREQDLKTALERQTQEANTELEKLRTDHQSQLAALQQEKDAALETAQAAAQGALQNQLAEANAQQKAELEQLRGQLANANTANEAAQGALQSQLKQQQDANAVLEQQASQHATVLAEAQEAQEAADLANREKERQIIVVLRAQKAINEAARKELEMQHATALAKQKAEHDAALTQQKAALEQQAREAREAQEQLKKNTIDVGVQTGDIIGADGVVRVIVGESGDGVDGVDREPKASDPAALNTDGGRVEFNPPEGVKAIFCGKKDDEIVVVCAFDGETSKAFAEIGGSQKKNDEEKSSLLKTHRVSNPDEGVELYENNNIAKLQEKAKSEDMQSVMFKYNEKTRNLDITFNKEDAEATFSSNKFKYVISIVGDQCHMDCYNKDDDSLNPLTGEAEKEALKNIAKNNIKIFDKNDEMSFPNSAVAEPAVEALKGAGRGGGHVLG